MKIVKKSEAMKFMGLEGVKEMKFDSGKYAWNGSAKDYYGKDVVDLPDVLAVFIERKQDSEGAYGQLRCVTRG